VRPDAPVGHTPIVRAWWTRDHRAALSAISPAGQRYCHRQDHAIASAEVVAFLDHLRRDVSGRMVIIGAGAPRHRRHLIREFLANGAAPRQQLERRPAYAPERNPGDGLWPQRKGVERRQVCGVTMSPLRVARRAAVTRVRRTPRLLQSVFRGAKL
jgi:putative transposase